MTLREALISQGNDSECADEIIAEMKERVLNGEDPEDVLAEEGLEPEYVLDLLDVI